MHHLTLHDVPPCAGAVEFWPVVVHIPIMMYRRLHPKLSAATGAALWMIDGVALLLSLAVLVASIISMVMTYNFNL